jgi:hypothetical protein
MFKLITAKLEKPDPIMDEIKQIPKLRPTTVTRDHTCITQRPPINYISFPLNTFLLTTQNGHLYK